MATNICSDAYRNTWQVRLNHLSVPEVELSTTFWGSFIFSIYKITETLCIFIKLYIYHIISGGFCHSLNGFYLSIFYWLSNYHVCLLFIWYPIIIFINRVYYRPSVCWQRARDTHYHNYSFTASLCHQPISRYIFTQTTHSTNIRGYYLHQGI